MVLTASLCSGPQQSHAGEAAAPAPVRSLKICAAADADPRIRGAAQAVLDSLPKHALLSAMAADAPAPTELTDTAALAAAKPEDRAFSHLVLVGLPDDPMIQAAWQREARQTDAGLYVFGFGHFSGDVGYVESDRNPFLHGQAIKSAPFETQVVAITGSTPAGVALAADAFIRAGLINGIVATGAVAANGWTRARGNLLQRDPLPPDFRLPDCLPAKAGGLARIAVSQAAEDEYRGVLANTGTEPKEIWRAKYHKPGLWDGAGAGAAQANYHAGLHRRSYGYTLWAARFATPGEAAAAAPKIAARAGLRKAATHWEGQQPPLGYGESTGPLALWQRGEWVLMSTLPADDTAAIPR